ncbi:unnamed protein product [Spirodela intermedia]|uniref:Peroxidase n=1 Tax=Spirodela intermedia TaxID=51605 RepID=A0A7I8JP87_SPIIN|nr:unnamed protein product [Spirodela intermedia]CAA6671920.1 unnamed protein product [Spirodela intermedia]
MCLQFLRFQDYYKGTEEQGREIPIRIPQSLPVGYLKDTARQCCTIVFPAVLVVLLLGSADAQLEVGDCRAEINLVMRVSPTLGGSLLRFFFHDCFVRVRYLLQRSPQRDNKPPSNPAEKDSIPNSFLRGFKVIDTIKANLEKACPSTVSCADVLALVARDVVSLVGLLILVPQVPTGRRDGRVSIMSEALNMLPGFTANISSLKSQFAAQGLSVKDLVVLSGAHTLGNAHCFTVTDRIYNFSGRGTIPIPTRPLTRAFSPSTTVTLPWSQKTGLFQSDAALLDDLETRAYVLRQANAPPTEFFEDFGVSMVNMGNIGVLTGSQGEIRKQFDLF